MSEVVTEPLILVALRKESVDRNWPCGLLSMLTSVALRKESVDRNLITLGGSGVGSWSLSARRAWIEIDVDSASGTLSDTSLSARRAWIEICGGAFGRRSALCRSPQGERG